MTIATHYGTGNGICSATPVKTICTLWSRLKQSGFDNRCSIRVFEGHLYSLMDDDEYYEGSGNRKRINSLLYTWDHLRECALKDEKEESFDWSSRNIKRSDADHHRIGLLSESIDRDLQVLLDRSW